MAEVVDTMPLRPKMRMVRRGDGRRGFPIESRQLSRDGLAAASGGMRVELSVSTAPIDPSLFTVPAGYRPALPRGTSADLTLPDTWANRAGRLLDRSRQLELATDLPSRPVAVRPAPSVVPKT